MDIADLAGGPVHEGARFLHSCTFIQKLHYTVEVKPKAN